jgi:hypothetical protein
VVALTKEEEDEIDDFMALTPLLPDAGEVPEAPAEPDVEAGEIEEGEYEEEPISASQITPAPAAPEVGEIEEPDILELRSRDVVQSGTPAPSQPPKAASPAPEPTPTAEDPDVLSLRNRDVLQNPAPNVRGKSPAPETGGGRKFTPAPITWTPTTSAVKRKAEETPEGEKSATPAAGW